MADYQPIPLDLLPDAPQFVRVLNDRLSGMALNVTQVETAPHPELVINTTHEMRAAGRYRATDYHGSFLVESNRTAAYASVPWGAQGYQWIFVAGLMVDLLAKRPIDLTVFDAGFEFYAKDKTHLYRWDGKQFQVISGELVDPDAGGTLALKPATLTPGDANFRYRSLYFGRQWRWSGTAWQYSDGGIGAGAHTFTSGGPPEGGLWQTADGSTVPCALDNCTIGDKTALDTRSSGGDDPVLRGGAGGAPSPATPATFAGGAAIVSGNDSDAGVTFLAAGSGSTAAVNPHTHPIALPALNPPSAATGGLEFGVSCAVWMRR